MVILATNADDDDDDDDMTQKPTCVLDQTVVNEKTITQMTDLGLSFFATLCGKNRGVFVLDPSDGHSWGCTAFPPNFAELAGVELPDITEITDEEITTTEDSTSNATDDSSNSTRSLKTKDVDSTKATSTANTTESSSTTTTPVVKPVNLKDANAIKDALNGGNITSSDAVKILDMLVKRVYGSTPGVDQDVYACEVSGVARLQCNPVNTLPTIRSATLTGLFVDALWATKGKKLSEEQRRSFYTADDFDDMRSLGLNMVQIPIPLNMFDPDLPATYHKSGALVLDHLTDVLEMVKDADLQAILVLHGADNDDAVASAAKYAASTNVVFGMTLPSAQSFRAARAAASELKLFVPTNQGALKDLVVPDDNVFASIDFSHDTNIGDIASSNSQEDRSKLFYHEAISCMGRSPLEYSACYRRVPVMVSSGFDLAIDDCHRKHDPDYKWIDYGQCNRLEETVDSPWWQRHRESHAARQLFAYEQGMGWSFTAWKLYGGHDSSSSSSSSHSDGIMDHPAKLLALKNVHAAGLFPSLHKGKSLAKKACLNPPVTDFVLGDDTLAPTAGPPPDCGNGWWNASIQDCTYWVPPPEPTPCPTMAPVVVQECDAAAASTQSLTMAAGLGALVALVVGGFLMKVLGYKRGRDGYAEIPSHNNNGRNTGGYHD